MNALALRGRRASGPVQGGAPLKAASTNSEHYQAVSDAKATILAHPLFRNISKQDPLQLGQEGCTTAPFRQAEYETTLKMAQTVSRPKLKPFKQYKAGGNVMWLDVSSQPLPGVPINRRRIQTIIDLKLQTPSSARADQKEITVGTLRADGASLERGSMRVISPDESVHALLIRVGERLDESCSEEEAKEWRAVLLSWPMVFEQHASLDDLLWSSINMREDIGTSFDTLYRSPVQRCFELMIYKQEQESSRGKKVRGKEVAMTAKELFEDWQSRVQFGSIATGERAFKISFVEACLTVFNRLLSVPECRDMILQSEARSKLPCEA